MKKTGKVLLAILAFLLIVVIGYLIYVFGSYKRIEDNLDLSPENIGQTSSSGIELNSEYSILTYNIGFGAYEQDYSFFMDGGKYSWARSEDGLIRNIDNISSVIDSLNADFVVLQEVDTDGTRTYHVNEYQQIRSFLGDGSYVFAQNFDSPFLMYPFNEPHGANQSGLVTISPFAVHDAIRRSLPVASSVTKIVDLDRCYSISRIPVEDGRYLCIYNVHLSAYTNDAGVRSGQLNMLFEDMRSDYEAGNFIICGGDYNHNLRIGASPNAPGWASVFPREELPDGFSMAFDVCEDVNIEHDSCRNADAPYDPEVAYTVLVDGFIVSDNIEVLSYEATDYQYMYSDHDPVMMRFILK